MKRFIVMISTPAAMIAFCLCALFLFLTIRDVNDNDLPIAYKGRFRPIEAYNHAEPTKTLWSPAETPESEKGLAQTLRNLKKRGTPAREISHQLETQYPLQARLRSASDNLLLLPGKQGNEWYSLHALKISEYDPDLNALVPVENFTAYPDAIYDKLSKTIRDNTTFTEQTKKHIAGLLFEGYKPLAGENYMESSGKALSYPTLLQLKAESFYFRYPLIPATIFLYAGAALLAFTALWIRRSLMKNCSLLFLWSAFSLHTVVLGLRCFILGRPPVSNMFETIVYVPWIAVAASLFLIARSRSLWILIAASSISAVLLAILGIAKLNNSLDNVQAVLDSHYWLIIHVLMVVGSYGFFILSGTLGHIYLLGFAYNRGETPKLAHLSKLILQCLYLGTALLISGTILGGVWAAQSWGRFWDWDPKEAWAFISSCVYLMGIHAYRFKHIGNFGLAIASIAGFQAISFTWYGVNYILGTGLHSYGFGSGGEIYYYLFIAIDLVFIGCMLWLRPRLKIGPMDRLD